MILYFIEQGQEPPKHCSTKRDVLSGPNGKPGTIYSDGSGETGYYPDRQEWQLIKGFHIGTAGGTHPEDLQRQPLLSGHAVELADGNKWVIPCARFFPAGTALPEVMALGEDGELIKKILPRYQPLADAADDVWKALTGEKEMTNGKLWEIANLALKANYKVSEVEASALRILTTTNVIEIGKALVDYPAIEEALKKKEEQAEGDSMKGGSGE